MPDFNLTTENWREVPGYEGIYQVSDLGRVKRISAWNTGIGTRRPSGTIKPLLSGKYYHLMLYKDGVGKNHCVHSLVAAAFIGSRPAGEQVNHIDGDKANCRALNLEYVTASQNQRHAARNGLAPRGERHNLSRHTEAQMTMVKEMLDAGKRKKEIRLVTGVSMSAICAFARGDSWKHLH